MGSIELMQLEKDSIEKELKEVNKNIKEIKCNIKVKDKLKKTGPKEYTKV